MRDALTDEDLAELAATPRQGHGQWGRADFRLAAIEDALRQQTAINIWLAGKRDGQPKLPEPIPRPGVATRKRRRLSDADRAYLNHLRANRGALPAGMQFIAAS